MEVRDAVEADADRLAELTDAPVDVMGNLIHDRTVRVAETDDPKADGEGTQVAAFVSFDARRNTVHVTQFDGAAAACERLLEEPAGFARSEGMAVELLIEEGREDLRDAAEAAGFERVGPGPAFDGTPTIRFRLDT